MPTYSAEAWTRLGERLIERRVGLDPRYKNRRAFCEATGLNYKIVEDIENSRRTNFGRETLASIEIAYRWRPGSIRQVLVGGEPIPSQAPSDPESSGERSIAPSNAPGEYPDFVGNDPLRRHIWDGPGSEDERRSAILAIVEKDLRRVRAEIEHLTGKTQDAGVADLGKVTEERRQAEERDRNEGRRA